MIAKFEGAAEPTNFGFGHYSVFERITGSREANSMPLLIHQKQKVQETTHMAATANRDDRNLG